MLQHSGKLFVAVYPVLLQRKATFFRKNNGFGRKTWLARQLKQQLIAVAAFPFKISDQCHYKKDHDG